ncbi:hypothetical protein, partial [Lysinibacillus sp. NPDC096212]|uniref:hypothetical protein n=1 Tax=Lysinibacillus sp. NPDC096212 TaxID=3364135 RepID=UPI003822AAC1
LEKAAACKIQTAASKGCLAFFQNVLYKGYTLKFESALLHCRPNKLVRIGSIFKRKALKHK